MRASVVYYDDRQRKWIPSGPPPGGISRLQILHDPVTCGYRIFATKIQDKQVKV